MLLAFFLLASSVVLRDDTNTVPPQRWRYERFITRDQLPVDVDCSFRVVQGPSVRVELVTEENLEALRRGQPHEFIAASTTGTLREEIGVPGTFAVVIINSDKSQAADVAMRLSLDFSAKSLTVTGQLSPEKKLVVILLSFGGFLAIVSLSARKLIQSMRNVRLAARSTSSHIRDEGGSIAPTPDRDPD
jgi:hypothetical protein